MTRKYLNLFNIVGTLVGNGMLYIKGRHGGFTKPPRIGRRKLMPAKVLKTRPDIMAHRKALEAVRRDAELDARAAGSPAGPTGLYVAARCRETPLMPGAHKDPGGRRREARAVAKAQAARDDRAALAARLAMSRRQVKRQGTLFRALRAEVGQGILAV